MALKSGFTDEHSTVCDVMAPGPLRAVSGLHYQEFTNLPAPERLTPDPYGVGEQKTGSVWEEFLVPDTAKVITWFDDPDWHFPAITRNDYGAGSLTYEGTFLSDPLQRAVIRDLLKQAGITGTDEELPPALKVRHGRNRPGKLLHYYLNFSRTEQTVSYPYADSADLLTGSVIQHGNSLKLGPWDLVIIREDR